MSSRNYESVFIIAPTLSADAQDRLITTFEEIITSMGGNLLATNKWGRKTLAYDIKDFKEGYYVEFDFEGNGEIVKELERRYRLSDPVIRYLTVRVDRAMKLAAKGSERRKAKEAKSKHRSRRKETSEGARS